MGRELIRYEFRSEVPLSEVEGMLVLAVLAVGALMGETAGQIDARYALDPARGICLIDAGTETGKSIAKIFTGLATKEFGAGAFAVERVLGPVSTPAA